MRAYFLEENVHNCAEQALGPEHKALLRACILSEFGGFNTKVSLYRPKTKNGDPRMWIYGLRQYSEGNDIHALFFHKGVLYSINITRVDVRRCCDSATSNPIRDIVKDIENDVCSVSEELLGIFLSVGNRWFEVEVAADTGVGRTIETFLGIKMNSDKTPDYKGIEIKSHRDKRKTTRNVLFTQTPDWDISRLKSGKEIVKAYGYFTADGLKTYQNTVQCGKPNKQSLVLSVNSALETLELLYKGESTKDIAAWRLLKLHQRLLMKHKETFWVEVETRNDNGKEYFRYKRIEHTKNPNVGQFDILMEQALITIDLLLCRPSGHGDTYSFKIRKAGMPLLFPTSYTYDV